jgi:LAS superfamily LD-carboxypeptidase LdcB
LGLATIAAPISGVLSVPAPAKAAFNEITSPSVAAPAFPLREHLPTAVERLSLVPDDESLPSVPKNLAAPRQGVLVRSPSSRSRERAVLPGCNGEFPLLKVDNGRLPASMLCTLWDGKQKLRPDAAVALARLNVAYSQEFGHPLCVSDAYRTLGEQYAVKAQRGWLAATAGTSNHGLGVAVDLCDDVENSGSRTHAWMVDNADLFGWGNPDWARRGGSGPFEPWHWEFTPSTEDADTSTG